MTDVIEGTVTPGVVNAACNAGGKLLKAVELQMKYGKPGMNDGVKTLRLCGDAEVIDPVEEQRKQLLDARQRIEEALASLPPLNDSQAKRA